MRMPRREEYMAPRHSQAARIQWRGPAIDTQTRQLMVEQATVDADGWARGFEDGHVSVASVQVGPCGDPPMGSAL
jgi:hypothetical protein